ncbi:unnamed protein product [Nezara viridula]|uniref:CUB domain-containing protein n=1 Tax=Nezara viridula TaxID=85310 RepID=A0A9P0HK58_NEZVI|nr:unnamed protein product [Nezara viridula]
MSVEEKSRPLAGGLWCGTSWGPVLYYSETDSLSLHITLLTLSSDQNGYNFDFRISYKMLSRTVATTRFGGVIIRDLEDKSLEEANNIDLATNRSQLEGEYFLGNRIGMTYCSRMFSDCDRKDCRLQSPNFPGVYPRNMTCYYAVRQQAIPKGKHALISVYQPEGQLVNIRSQSALYIAPTQTSNSHFKSLKVWEECDEVQDYVTVYDGYTTRDPVLLRFCGGGASVPRAVSSGPELLVEFSTSPYGTFLYPATIPQPLHGFQLKVAVEFVDREEPLYTRNKKCEFWLSGTGHGVLESPRNSLPPNTTCLYHFWGAVPGTTAPPKQHPRPPRYRVWLSILKYHVGLSPNEEMQPQYSEKKDVDCSTSLNIWDGTIKTAPACAKENCKDTSQQTVMNSGVKLLASYCQQQIPRSCDHQLLSNLTRPCTLSESFLSSGDSATLELKMVEATVLRRVSFKALYEFVDFHQDGEQYGIGKCSRIFTPHQIHPSIQYTAQNFASPREIFLFGRGGSKNISCRYRFEAQKGERVRLTLTNLRAGNRSDCETQNEGGWGRLECVGKPSAFVQIQEVPVSGSEIFLPKDCLCTNAEPFLPFTYTSNSHIVELHFIVNNMSHFDDYTNLGFEGTWEFVRRPPCEKRKLLHGPSGEIIFTAPSQSREDINCEGQPWVIEPSQARYLYVKVPGVVVGRSGNNARDRRYCYTENRIELHSQSTHVMVCPTPDSPNNIVEIFSDGWVIANSAERLPPDWAKNDKKESRNIIVEFSGRQAGVYIVTWLELIRRRTEDTTMGLLGDCPFKCPELDACINSTLWCDGTSNCPSGFDESPNHCLPLPPVQLALLSIIILISISLVVTFLCRLRKGRRRQSLKSLPSDTDTIVSSSGGKEVIC